MKVHQNAREVINGVSNVKVSFEMTFLLQFSPPPVVEIIKKSLPAVQTALKSSIDSTMNTF